MQSECCSRPSRASHLESVAAAVAATPGRMRPAPRTRAKEAPRRRDRARAMGPVGPGTTEGRARAPDPALRRLEAEARVAARRTRLPPAMAPAEAVPAEARRAQVPRRAVAEARVAARTTRAPPAVAPPEAEARVAARTTRAPPAVAPAEAAPAEAHRAPALRRAEAEARAARMTQGPRATHPATQRPRATPRLPATADPGQREIPAVPVPR